MLGLAVFLLVMTGLWRIFEIWMHEANASTRRLRLIGVVYLVFGILIALQIGVPYTVWAALVLMVLGMVAAFMVWTRARLRPWVKWVLIALDAVIVAGLALGSV